MSINLLFCGDDYMRHGLLTSLLSIQKHTNESLHVYILTATIPTPQKTYRAISQNTVDFLQHQLRATNPDSFIKLFDITDMFMSELPTANMNTRFTPYCMLRLWADKVPDIPDRILYLDTDIMCAKNFDKFYLQNIDNVELVGVLDYYGSWFFKKRAWDIKRNYMNSGMFLFNMARIRETGLFAKARRMCQSRTMFMPDQSALNKLVVNKRIVSRDFNEQHHLRKSTVFQHFSTKLHFFPWFYTVTVKPWDVEAVHNTLKLHAYDDVLSEDEKLIPTMP